LKKIVDILNTKGIVLKSLVEIEPSMLGSRQKIRIFSGVNEKSFYNVIFRTKK